jgi:hypothetical protein
MGQPTKYRKAICDEIVEFMATGRSISAFAAEKKLSRDILYRWCERYPEFADAMAAGKEASQRWWEALAMAVASGSAAGHKTYKNANSGMVMFMMSRRFPDYYKKSDGGPIEGEGNGTTDDNVNEEELSNEIDRLIALRDRLRSSKKTADARDRGRGKK